MSITQHRVVLPKLSKAYIYMIHHDERIKDIDEDQPDPGQRRHRTSATQQVQDTTTSKQKEVYYTTDVKGVGLEFNKVADKTRWVEAAATD
ncbi:hypothetical protein NDU88_001033 [Pleurodeles waltl]|uniref:Uncharacterized protein n=1 Tax=Pleurodeles waltl TaxID=8319 RepID=A0AAV7THH8_PLEWA|nr:hypothetical protein NDU88_001033 [Pleurodeles waltl]